jgi:Mg-chelatase subunit ChlI-like protein
MCRQIGPGLPAFIVVGLPDKAVGESRERVRGALNAIGLALPPKRITVDFAPADQPKEGSHYDLPIALGLMAAIGAVAPDAIEGYCVLGELAPRRLDRRDRRRASRSDRCERARQGADLPARLRRRGCLGGSRHADPGAGQSASARQ